MGIKIRGWRPSALAVAAMLLFATVVPLVSTDKVSAYATLGERFIRLSDSTPDATDVVYAVSFDLGTTTNLEGVVLEFCSNTPIIQDSCTAPAGFDLQEATLALANQTGLGANAFSIHANTTANMLVLTRTTSSITAGATVSFELGTESGDGVDNPSATGSFYARLVTYDAAAGATGYQTTNVDNGDAAIDAGGIALSTAEQLIVTAKVAERLTFCVYVDTAQTPANDCSGSGSAITIGDTNGVLDPAGEYVNKDAFYGVSTNASGNVAINIKGSTLTSGASDTIDAMTTEAQNNTSIEQFGLCNYQDQGTGLTPDADYDGTIAATNDCSTTVDNSGGAAGSAAGSAYFTFNTTNTESTFGETIASKAAGDFSTGNLVFIANITNTTEAGIYTAALTFIATGTY